jgi:hypothetical protein
MKTLILIFTILFYCNIHSQNNIVAVEYFFDTDPGFDNAISLFVTNNNAISESYLIPTTSLNQGFHSLFMRVKNSENNWSLYARKLFYKSPPIGNNDIIAAEFFIDIDPGIGNAIPIVINPGTSVYEILNITIPNDLSSGDHFLHLRVLSSNGNWSLYGRPEFESTLSLNDNTFANLKLYPNPVEDVVHISFPNTTIKHIILVDLNGHIVRDQSHNLEQLDLSTVSPGYYLLQIYTINGSVSKKILKK